MIFGYAWGSILLLIGILNIRKYKKEVAKLKRLVSRQKNIEQF